jgi:ATP-dependent Clp protease ATP-binding subunit ClpB
VLDDGRLTDGQGRTVDFSNTVIVMTSNLGSDLIQSMVDEPHDLIRDAVMGVVAQHFRPEFINRVDESVVFHALGREHIRGILEVQIGHLRQRLESMDYGFLLSEDAADKLCDAGFDPVYGARPLKRAIQTLIENPLAELLLNGEFIAGDTIQANLDASGGIVFTR